MGISTDPRQLERLQQLESVLALLQNPESYTKLLADVKAMIARYELVVERYNSVEAANRFLQDSRKLLDQAKQESASTRAALEAERVELTAKGEKQRAELTAREDAVSVRERAASATITKLATESRTLSAARAEFDQTRDATMIDLTVRAQDMAQREEALRKRAHQISQLVNT